MPKLLLLSLLRQNGSTMLIKYIHTQHQVNKIYTYMKNTNYTEILIKGDHNIGPQAPAALLGYKP